MGYLKFCSSRLSIRVIANRRRLIGRGYSPHGTATHKFDVTLRRIPSARLKGVSLSSARRQPTDSATADETKRNSSCGSKAMHF
jgi:hypothetical protein